MVKIFIVMLTALLIFTSCGNLSADYLTYQNFPIELDAVMTFGGTKYDVYMSVTGVGEGAVIYKTPLTLAGYRYDIVGDEITVSYDRLIIKLPKGSAHPTATAVNMFTLSPDKMISAELTDHNGIKLNRITYDHDGETITVWCTHDNIPVRIESDTLVLDITNFKGNPQNERT